MKKKLLYLLILTLLVTFSSCMEEMLNGGEEEGGKVKLLETATFEVELETKVYKFEYDTQDRVRKETTLQYQFGILRYTEIIIFTYSDEGDLIRAVIGRTSHEYYQQTSITFEKNGNKITYKDSWYPDGPGKAIELNADGLPVKMYSLTFGSDYYSICEYHNDNLSKITEYDNNNHHYSATFTYDNKKSPFYHGKTPKWYYVDEDYVWGRALFMAIKNNPTKIVSANRDGEWGECGISYIYDEDGYPIAFTGWSRTGLGEVVSTGSFTYITK